MYTSARITASKATTHNYIQNMGKSSFFVLSHSWTRYSDRSISSPGLQRTGLLLSGSKSSSSKLLEVQCEVSTGSDDSMLATPAATMESPAANSDNSMSAAGVSQVTRASLTSAVQQTCFHVMLQ
ncbi:hypothetical protein AMECASPLE_013832 [Ameca splendens]|uniref:Uncharacterized protein n=1 Tax=Ameca splendens TaxID=208324 RepID=A0ABV0XEJ8_9TELE